MDETNKYALAALKRKRAEISGLILSLQRQVEDHKLELSALDGSIRLFLPSYAPGDVKPIRPYAKPQHFEQGELIRLILGTMREGNGPMTTVEIVKGVLEAKGHDPAMAPILGKRVLIGLNYLWRRGQRVKKEGFGKCTTWALA